MDKQSGTCRIYLLLQGLCVLNVITTTYVCNRFHTFFCATRGEGKNSLREHKDILVSDCGPLEFFFLIQP